MKELCEADLEAMKSDAEDWSPADDFSERLYLLDRELIKERDR